MHGDSSIGVAVAFMDNIVAVDILIHNAHIQTAIHNEEPVAYETFCLFVLHRDLLVSRVLPLRGDAGSAEVGCL